jgi:hypothetical protein
VEERLLTKATLHDELMREAGLESEYYADVARRSDERHRLARSARHRVLLLWYRVLLFLCLLAAIADLLGLVHYVPRGIAGVATVVAVVVLRADELGLRALLRRLGLIVEEEQRESRVAGAFRRLRLRVRRGREDGE